jgi:hypothetical protein
MAKSTLGTDLMRQLNEGALAQAPSEVIVKTRDEISGAIEELVDLGARVRPLLVGDRRVGWIRGVHLTERKMLQRWITDETEFITNLIGLATTLTEDEIRYLSIVEVRSLARLVRDMTDSDLRLYPYLSPFATTSISEQLWYSKGSNATTFRDREIRMPDGKVMKIMAASDQARMWATLCNYRIQSKNRLEASYNAVLTIRPMVGKGADGLSADLNNIARSLKTDSLEPWQEIIRTAPDIKFKDGWAHALEDDSIEGMRRELQGMLNLDRHEQVVAAFERQTREREEKRVKEHSEASKARRAARELPTKMVGMTEAEVQARNAAIRQKTHATPVMPEESQSSIMDRLAKYK